MSALDLILDNFDVRPDDRETCDADVAAARSELAEMRRYAPVGDTLADRVHDAYSRYRMVWLDELEEAIGAIVGEDRLRCAHVEHDSQNDNSVEVVLEGGAPLTEDERAKIKALGFSMVYNGARSVPAWLRIGDVEKDLAALVAERDALRDHLCVVLPLAKGYAAAHPVESNQEFIAAAERALAPEPAP